nr:unnamed protein product [Callosobruchus analis]
MHIFLRSLSDPGSQIGVGKDEGVHRITATYKAKGSTSIDAQWPGSVHDIRILNNSAIYAQLNNMRLNDMLSLGDCGYGISRWLMTPYRNPEISFNTLFTKERVIIERCFGQLKRSFSILQYMVRLKLNRVVSVIISCAVLHNISKYLNDPVPVDEQEDDMNDEEEEEYNSENEDEKVRRRALQRGEEIKNLIYQLQH